MNRLWLPLLTRPKPVRPAHRIIDANLRRRVVAKMHAVVPASAPAALRMLAIQTRLTRHRL
jgi:hypothetical protein